MAFYVNNWSEKQREKQEAYRMVAALIQEIDQDLEVYQNTKLEQNKEQTAYLRRAIRQIQAQEYDSLPLILKRGIGYKNYSPPKVSFKSIISSGKLGLIGDYNLQIQISNYYEALAVEAQFRGTAQIRFYNEHFLPLLIESTSLMNPKIDDLNLRQVTNLIILYQDLIEWKIKAYELLVEDGIVLKKQLEDYKAQL